MLNVDRENQTRIEGVIKKVIFYNKDNGWSVLSVKDNENNRYTVTGNFCELKEEQDIVLFGEMTIHPKYGQQLKATGYELPFPNSPEKIMDYIQSAIKGVGPKTAKRIYETFGDKIEEALENPEMLAKVKGITKNKAEKISEEYIEKQASRNLTIFMQQYGISPAYAVRIYNTYGDDVYKILKENPYQLANDVDGIGFKKADLIAQEAGVPFNSPFRIRSAIKFAMETAFSSGHTYLPYNELIQTTKDTLYAPDHEITVEEINNGVVELINSGEFINDRVIEDFVEIDRIYTSKMYNIETKTANMIKSLVRPLNVNIDKINNELSSLEDEIGITLDINQKKAIITALSNNFSIITGGPGTGKTTIVNCIIKYLTRKGLEVALAAPTGRASKRMSEVTNMPASTIHRLLEIGGGEDGKVRFNRNEDNPFDEDVILVDESSMIDQYLMYSLLRACSSHTRVIFVGDVDQLPSVGPGTVLKDMINSGYCPVARLTKIFRQSEDSYIVENAHKIINHQKFDLSRKSSDFFFIETETPEKTIGAAMTMICERIPQRTGINPIDIQVLSPIHKRALGVDNLNKILQDTLNPQTYGKEEVTKNFVTYRVGDKVMQTKNNYDKELIFELNNGKFHKMKGVFNGDVGYIRHIDNDDCTVDIQFENGGIANYKFEELNTVELAYAITIHKSQGSEYPIVVIPVVDWIPQMTTTNLLYTALTRAKKMVVFVGKKKIFNLMVDTISEPIRYTGLKDKLNPETL